MKLTHEGYMRLMLNKTGTKWTAEDHLQLIANAIRMFEADDATAHETMAMISEWVLPWVKDHIAPGDRPTN